MGTPYWPAIWKRLASEIIIEQGLEERMQKSAGTLSMLSAENTIVYWGFIPWGGHASDILKEQTSEDSEAQMNASSEVVLSQRALE